MTLGIDEVGRGAWAGPLVIGAVVLGGAEIEGLDDSKKLTKKRREGLDVAIREQASSWALGWVSAKELDEIGMSEALKLATRRAVKEIQAKCQKNGSTFDEIIIDGTVNFLAGTPLEKYVTMIAKADGLIPSVSAASIIAKVARDKFMAEQDDIYPGYDFSSHVGYGVPKHRAAIKRLGVTPLHRLSFAPLAKYAGVESNSQNASEEESKSQQKDTTRQIGNKGEQTAADWLVADGHEIIARNWRTRYCEIDIVSKKDKVLYFTEVKYRKNDNFGDGLAAITNKNSNKCVLLLEYSLPKIRSMKAVICKCWQFLLMEIRL
ncbi:ribonuclease HII [TM7 phylum sp. oral taxon 952]|nr:ribonuclease HII [TM7 phylum sp. oral taxon 952]